MRSAKRPAPIFLLAGLLLLALTALGWFLYQSGPAVPAIKIYFLKGESLAPVARPLQGSTEPLAAAARELMLGPTEEEKQSGLFSEIPPKARIQKIVREDGTVLISFNSELEKYGGGSARVRGLIAQIVYTFTEVPGVTKVRILVGKKGEVVLGGEGFVIDKPLARQDIKF
ncbi:GerMN domain-containing protein [Candidatus Saganbacteria bacterium]|nr:GerMN domain-containing protein [Candidatus Saganbacteria bacterium]